MSLQNEVLKNVVKTKELVKEYIILNNLDNTSLLDLAKELLQKAEDSLVSGV